MPGDAPGRRIEQEAREHESVDDLAVITSSSRALLHGVACILCSSKRKIISLWRKDSEREEQMLVWRVCVEIVLVIIVSPKLGEQCASSLYSWQIKIAMLELT